MLTLLTVFITERYRLVAVPGLLIFAAYGLSMFWDACARSQVRMAAVYLALLFASVVIVAWPQRSPSLWALDAYNSGWQALASSNLVLAERKLGLAYAYVPDNSETVFALGNLRLAQNHTNSAKSFYRAVIRIDPQHKGALNNLGLIDLEAGSFSEAQRFFEEALVQAPRDAKTYYLLAKTFLAEGNWAAAKGSIEKAIELRPTQPEFMVLQDEIHASQIHK